jgi:uncharacterized membrane protein
MQRSSLASVEPLEGRQLMAASYTLIDLDPFRGTGGAGSENGVHNSPDIANNGDVGGKGFYSTPIIQHATLRRVVKGKVVLYDLGNITVDRASDGKGINNAGGIAGSYSDANGRSHALYGQLTKKGKTLAVPLPDAKGLKGAVAYAINDKGLIVGSGGPLTGIETALVWTAGKKGKFGVTKLPKLGGGTGNPVPGLNYISIANDVNNKGVIAGMSVDDTLRQQAAIWVPGKNGRYGVVGLGSFAGSFGGSYAHAVNDKGLAVGLAYDGLDKHAVAFAPGKRGKYGLVDLPLPKGADAGQALEVNNNGVIVGTVEVGSDEKAVMWVPGKKGRYSVVDLNKFAPQGWELEQATGINDAGAIVGTGLRPGTATFLLSPGKAATATAATTPAQAPTIRPTSPFSKVSIKQDVLA